MIMEKRMRIITDEKQPKSCLYVAKHLTHLKIGHSNPWFACVLKKVVVTERERIHLLSFMIVLWISPHGKLLWTSNGGLEILRSLNWLLLYEQCALKESIT
jgi:hypothetical protein